MGKSQVDAGLQPQIIAITIAAPCVSLVFVVLRLYTRKYITKNLNWDDMLIVVPMALSIGFAYTTVQSVKAEFIGYHTKDIPVGQFDPVLGAKYGYAAQLLYNLILALVKNAVLIFYLRVGGIIGTIRWFTIALMGLNTLMMVAIFVADMLQCIPVGKVFDTTIPGSCINIPAFFLSTAALNITTDVLVLSVPTWIIGQLQMRLAKKIAIIILLSLGLLVTGISIYRLYFMIDAYYGPTNADPTYSLGGTAAGIEVNLAIATACAPFLKPVIQQLFSVSFGTGSTIRDTNGNGTNISIYTRKRRSYVSARARSLDIYGDNSKMVTFELRTGASGDARRALPSEDGDSQKEIWIDSRRKGIMRQVQIDVSYEQKT